MRHCDVPLPRTIDEEEDNGSEAQSRKRGNVECQSDEIMKKIKELMNISDNRNGNMIIDLSEEMEGFERRCEARA